MSENNPQNTGSDGRSRGTDEVLLTELAKVVAPVGTAARNARQGEEEDLLVLLDDMGLSEAVLGTQATVLRETLTELGGAWVSIRTLLAELISDEGSPSPGQIADAVDAFGTLFDGIDGLDEIDAGLSRSVGDVVVDYLLVRYLDLHHPTLYSTFRVMDVIQGVDAEDARPKLVVEKLPERIANPEQLQSDVLEWGTKEFKVYVLLQYLQEGLEGLGVPAAIDPASDVQALWGSGVPPRSYELRVPIVRGPSGTAGVRLLSIPADSSHHPGLAVVPYGMASLSVEDGVDLGDGWSLTGDVSTAASAGGYGIVIRPKPDGSVETSLETVSSGSAAAAEFHAETAIAYNASEDDDADAGADTGDDSDGTILLGTPDGSRVALHSVSLRLQADYSDRSTSFGVELPSSGSVVIEPQGGFLRIVLPDRVAADFDVTAGWSSADGLYVESGGTLTVGLPMHTSIGPITLERLYLSVSPDLESGTFTVEATAAASVTLGPITGTVKRMGLGAELSFPDDHGGRFGPMDLDVGFEPPDGLGLSIEAGAVSGGGYMEFEPEKHRYAGTFELSFNDYSVTVVGLLKTKLPGGRDGFSLLLLVTGQLPPVQLGFGFTLNGIGGLVGVHRDMRSKPLGNVVRSGNLDSVLFPENVVERATQIVSDLRSIFPPTTDVFVIGPMVRIGWGIPTLVTMDVGVVLAIPRWKIALLGKMEMVLPDEETAMIDLNLAVAGLLDIPGKRVRIDASLYKSRLVQWELSGGMALRSSWGRQSRFALSCGGFHPRFEPPKSFPSVRRLTASLGAPGGNPTVEFTGYLSVTPNTFQVGAGISAHAEAGPASFDGELSFDALFEFNPFAFVVDFHAKWNFRIKGFERGIDIDGRLSGPKPWHINGKVSIDVAFVSVTVHVDVTMGSKPAKQQIPAAKVLPELTRALEQTANWDAQRPAGRTLPVSLRDPTDESDGDTERLQDREVLVHPLGSIRVRQTVVPLGVTLEKYGNAKPVNARFDLTTFEMSGSTGTLPTAEELREEFAPAKFKRMSDSEQLNAQAFERLKAGRVVENDLCYYTGQDQSEHRLVKATTLTYESTVIDREQDTYGLKPGDTDGWDGGDDELNVHDGHELANTGAAAVSGARTAGSAKFVNRAEPTHEPTAFSVSDTRYSVVSSRDMTRVDMSTVQGVSNPAGGLTQVEAQEARDAYAARRSTEVEVVPTHEVRTPGGRN